MGTYKVWALLTMELDETDVQAGDLGCTDACTGQDDPDHAGTRQHRPDWEQASLDPVALASRLDRSWGMTGLTHEPIYPEGELVAGDDGTGLTGDAPVTWRWKIVPGTVILGHPPVPARLCACGCGWPVTGHRPDAKYATPACRTRTHRAARAAAGPH